MLHVYCYILLFISRYEIMLSTWSAAPSKRPTFSSITSSLKKIVEDLNVQSYLTPSVLLGCDEQLERSWSAAEDMTCEFPISLIMLVPLYSKCLGILVPWYYIILYLNPNVVQLPFSFEQNSYNYTNHLYRLNHIIANHLVLYPHSFLLPIHPRRLSREMRTCAILDFVLYNFTCMQR